MTVYVMVCDDSERLRNHYSVEFQLILFVLSRSFLFLAISIYSTAMT